MNRSKSKGEHKDKIEEFNPVKVHSVASEIEAEIIMNILIENDIQCFKKSNGSGPFMNKYMGYSVYGEDIYVNEKDYQISLDLINSMSTNEERAEDEIEEADDDYGIPIYRKPKFVTRAIIIAFVLLIIMFIVLGIVNNVTVQY